jgi:FkbM family methyltransferase
MKDGPFKSEDALEINESRATFLKSFMPDLISDTKMTTALDVGCGSLGFFSSFLHEMGLDVTALDGRPENVADASKLNPSIEFKVGDIEDPQIISLGKFDLVLCFGLLYHLENPFRAIRNLHALTEKCLLIEAQTAPYESLTSVLYEESRASNQSLNYVAFMPTESSLVKMLYKGGFTRVYRPCRLPEHPDFRGSLTRKRARTVLMASKLDNNKIRRKWAVKKFCLVSEPRLPTLSPRNWDTTIGRMIRSVKEPGVTARYLFNRSIQFVPSSYTLKVSSYMASPRPLRLWPGWKLGADDSRIHASTIMRRILWRIFSLKASDETFILRWYNDIKITAYPNVATCRSLFVTGYYEPNEFYFLENNVRPRMVFIDIGAHMGLYSIFASKLVDKNGIVIAVEPSERDFRRLKANLELNRCENIRLRQIAISNRSCERELLIAADEHSGLNTLGAFAYSGVQNQGKQQVKTETLDAVVEREALNTVNVIKIDVEGHELFVLEGAKKTLSRFCPILLLELSDRTLTHQGCSSSQVLNFLRELRYRIYSFSGETGLPVPLNKEIEYFDSENILAIHNSSQVNFNGST